MVIYVVILRILPMFFYWWYIYNQILNIYIYWNSLKTQGAIIILHHFYYCWFLECNAFNVIFHYYFLNKLDTFHQHVCFYCSRWFFTLGVQLMLAVALLVFHYISCFQCSINVYSCAYNCSCFSIDSCFFIQDQCFELLYFYFNF